MFTVIRLSLTHGDLKKIKVFERSPDYLVRDLKSMDIKFTKLLTLPCLTFLFLGLFPIESSHSLSGQVKKNCFLAFHSPPPLRFHEVAETADRSNLLTLGKPVSQNFEINIVDGNKSVQVNEFPLTSYGDDENESSSDILPDNHNFLPPADPFSEFGIGDSNIDSTDQLIELFENLEKSGSSSSRVTVNFIPPYSSDSGNFRIQSSSSYIRRNR